MKKSKKVYEVVFGKMCSEKDGGEYSNFNKCIVVAEDVEKALVEAKKFSEDGYFVVEVKMVIKLS